MPREVNSPAFGKKGRRVRLSPSEVSVAAKKKPKVVKKAKVVARKSAAKKAAAKRPGTKKAPARKPAARKPESKEQWLIEVTPLAGDPDGKKLLGEAHVLGIGARSARSAVVYELSGIGGREAEELAQKLVSDPLLERARVTADASSGAAQPARGERIATCVRKPGVMDPVALSTLAAAKDLGVSLADVRVARRVYVEGEVPESELARLANKVLGNEALDRVLLEETPLPQRSAPARAKGSPRTPVRLRKLTPAQLVALSRERSLALDVTEMQAIQEHYKELGREPTDIELETIAQTWSEHCKHKTLTGPIELAETDLAGRETRTSIGNLLKETIFGSTQELMASGPARERCVSVFEDNAGVIRLDEKMGIAVKVETHNHPSAIEPYGGSGTGVGGVIRDILGTGLGARPIASIDVFCVGDLHAREEDVPAGALHPRRLLAGVVAGVRDYGNRMGIPTVAGSVISEKRYIGNPLVYCGTIGTIPLERVAKDAKPGDRVVVAGGRTGRDGIHGATFSSETLTSESERLSSGAVQIGNAIEEKKLADVLLALRDRGWLRAVTDCGAGGLSSAVGEMARTTGAEVDLAKVPLKYAGLAPWEIWVSEAQERMVLAVSPDRVAAVLEAFAREDVEAVDLGVFRDDGKLVLRHGETVVGELDQEFLHDGLPRTPLRAEWIERPVRPLQAPAMPHLEALRRLLAHPSIASREWIIRQYDHEVQGQSALHALQGLRSDGPGDATAVAAAPGSRRGVLVGLGCQPRISDQDPYLSAWASIDEAIRNVVASGGDPEQCAILDNFSWGDCRRDVHELGGIVRAARACKEAALLHRAPFISGKDSLNNSYVLPDGDKIAIPGTLLVTCVAVYDDPGELVSMDLKAPGEHLYLVGTTRDELGCSHWLEVVGGTGGRAPAPAREAPGVYRKLHAAIKAGTVSAVHDLSEGGLAVALAEMAFSGEVGARIELEHVTREPGCDDRALLFSESCGRLLVSVPVGHESAFERLLAGTAFARIGETTDEPRLRVHGLGSEIAIDAPLAELKAGWQRPLVALYEEP
jgi:phosphoribosylformylglycinamidine synthase